MFTLYFSFWEILRGFYSPFPSLYPFHLYLSLSLSYLSLPLYISPSTFLSLSLISIFLFGVSNGRFCPFFLNPTQITCSNTVFYVYLRKLSQNFKTIWLHLIFMSFSWVKRTVLTYLSILTFSIGKRTTLVHQKNVIGAFLFLMLLFSLLHMDHFLGSFTSQSTYRSHSRCWTSNSTYVFHNLHIF